MISRLLEVLCSQVPVNYLEQTWVEQVGGEDAADVLSKDDPAVLAFIERKSYLIALDPEHDIDMPPEIGLDQSKYVATLGHKTNHWFTPNCYFGWATHPRHGRLGYKTFAIEVIKQCFRIRSVVSLRAIKAGEELTVDYDYQPQDKYTPAWYNKLYHFMYSINN